jgi:hypothetical protein
MSVSWIDYQGKKILLWNNTDSDLDHLSKDMREYFGIIEKCRERILSLINLNDASLLSNPEYVEESKKRGKELTAKVIKSAIVGVSGLRKVFLSGYLIATGQRTIIKAFDSEQEAKDWLVTE